MAEQNDQTNTSFFLIAGFILVVGILCTIFWIGNLQAGEFEGFRTNFKAGRAVRLPSPAVADDHTETAGQTEASGQAEEGGAEAVAAPADDTTVSIDDVVDAITKGGCPACHTIPGVDGAVGQIGPSLSNIGVDGATRRDGYTAEEYIRESVQDPLAFTAPECPTGPCIAGAMPPVLLEPEEFDIIVTYLVTLDGGNE